MSSVEAHAGAGTPLASSLRTQRPITADAYAAADKDASIKGKRWSGDMKALSTWVGGREVYRAPGYE